MVPTTTPREALYIETGIMDIEHQVVRNRVNMYYRLEETKNKC
jgi:hypothetical protein